MPDFLVAGLWTLLAARHENPSHVGGAKASFGEDGAAVGSGAEVVGNHRVMFVRDFVRECVRPRPRR